MYSPNKIYKESNTLLGVFSKQHGLNYLSDYYKGIVYA
jgi:hypothetical protein